MIKNVGINLVFHFYISYFPLLLPNELVTFICNEIWVSNFLSVVRQISKHYYVDDSKDFSPPVIFYTNYAPFLLSDVMHLKILVIQTPHPLWSRFVFNLGRGGIM